MEFWKNKKVFITGQTGFKGTWLSLWLINLGAKVKGYALKPDNSPSLYYETGLSSKINSEYGDIENFENLFRSIQSFDPEIVFHMAAQPLVRESYKDPLRTYRTNVIGTANVLEACRGLKKLKSVIVITTDKCYENKEWMWGYRESDPMGGHDPYSSSKACAELVTSAYRSSYFNKSKIGVASVRAGNVIGGGDWSNDRLIPDILSSFQKNMKVIIRNPNAIRPWQHVLEPLNGYLKLAEMIYSDKDKYSQAYNFGPIDDDCKSVEWIIDEIDKNWDNSPGWKMDENYNPHEAQFLKLDISKANSMLNWKPKWTLIYAINKIVKWHQAWINKEDMYSYCIREIEEFQKF